MKNAWVFIPLQKNSIMFKILLFIFLLSYAYRNFIQPLLNPGGQQNSRNDILDEDDYIDYEEVD